jgi:hypothetical protein
VLKHLGDSITEAVLNNLWCHANGIQTGGDYLKLWIASLFQEPLEPLPYLFLFGPQGGGKSLFYEAISLLLTMGVIDARSAMEDSRGFNKELEGNILCYIEEVDLNKSKHCYNRIKDWVTARTLLIHEKGSTPYTVPNTTHWVQLSNDQSYCPIFPGDTRIVMIFVDSVDPVNMIPKKLLIPRLQREAPDFLGSILGIELPSSNDRLNIPVVESMPKMTLIEATKSPLQDFFETRCELVEGSVIKFSDFYDRFQATLSGSDLEYWSKKRVGMHIPPVYIKARGPDAQFYLGNVAWKDDHKSPGKKLTIINGFLREI